MVSLMKVMFSLVSWCKRFHDFSKTVLMPAQRLIYYYSYSLQYSLPPEWQFDPRSLDALRSSWQGVLSLPPAHVDQERMPNLKHSMSTYWCNQYLWLTTFCTWKKYDSNKYTLDSIVHLLWWGTRRWSRRQTTEIRMFFVCLFVIKVYYGTPFKCGLTSYGLNTICIMLVMPRSGWSTMAALTLVLEKHWINWWGGCSWWVPSGWVLYLSPRSTGSNGQEWDPISTPLPGTAH